MVKLLDFGLARLASNQTTLTTTGQMIGTLDFLAPEQASDARQVDIRCDIYSLGCTFYFLLTGQPPFSGPVYGTPASKIKGHLADRAAAADRRPRGEFRLPIVACLERMMAKSPDDRYQTPADVAAALAPHVRGANLPALASRALPAMRDGCESSRTPTTNPFGSGFVRLAGSTAADRSGERSGGIFIGARVSRPIAARADHVDRRRRRPDRAGSDSFAFLVHSARNAGQIPAARSGRQTIHYFRFGPDPAEHP